MSKVERIENGKVIELKQKPIIAYDLIEAKGKEVEQRLSELNIDAIDVNEDNLKLIKSTRSEIRKEFELLENQRKMVKELIMKPYNDFEAAYKEHIANRFKGADFKLKEKVSVVENDLLYKKTDALKSYFDEINDLDFVSFDDIGLKITRSVSDKKLKEEIASFVEDMKMAVDTIKTLQNSDRVMAKFQIVKDLNRAISETNIEIEREAQIKKQKEERERLAEERKKAQQSINEEIEQHKEKSNADEKESVQNKPKLYKASFTVTGTVEQITDLKKFMNEKGISYESK